MVRSFCSDWRPKIDPKNWNREKERNAFFEFSFLEKRLFQEIFFTFSGENYYNPEEFIHIFRIFKIIFFYRNNHSFIVNPRLFNILISKEP